MDFQAAKFVPKGLWNDQRWATIVSFHFIIVMRTPGNTGWRRAAVVQLPSQPLDRATSGAGRKNGELTAASTGGPHRQPLIEMDWTAYCCSCGNVLGPRPPDPVPHGDRFLRVLFSGFSSILVTSLIMTMERAGSTQEQKNSWRTTSLAAGVAEPPPHCPLASGLARVWGPSCAFGIKYRKGTGSRGSLTSCPLRR